MVFGPLLYFGKLWSIYKFGVLVSVFLNNPLAFSWGTGIFHSDTCNPLCFVVILELFQNSQFRIIQQWPNNSNSCESMDRRTYPLCQITSAIKKYWCKLNLELNLGVRKDEDNRLTRRGLLRIPGRAGPGVGSNGNETRYNSNGQRREEC